MKALINGVCILPSVLAIILRQDQAMRERIAVDATFEIVLGNFLVILSRLLLRDKFDDENYKNEIKKRTVEQRGMELDLRS